jgi:hypothetical protein
MAYTKIADTCGATSASPQSQTIVGRDRLSWRRADGRLFLFHRNDRNPLVTIEPDSKYPGMYRIRFPDGGLSDMVNLTRAKDAALAFALRSLNSVAQETPSDGPHGLLARGRS